MTEEGYFSEGFLARKDLGSSCGQVLQHPTEEVVRLRRPGSEFGRLQVRIERIVEQAYT